MDSSWLSRVVMRKTSLRQRFPVSKWLEGLKSLYSHVIQNSEDFLLKITGENNHDVGPRRIFSANRELLIRSGVPELASENDIKILQQKIENFEAGQAADSTPGEGPNDLDEEDTCDFKLLSLGKISPLMIGSLRFSTNSSSGSLQNRNSSQVNISSLFDSVALETIRKNGLYTVKTFEQFCDHDGKVMMQYKQDLARLDSQNSHQDLCIAETIKSAERSYFWDLR